MADYASDKPIFLIKKLGGLLFILVGCGLTAAGVSTGSSGLATVGIALLALGVALLVLKIVRRNQGVP